MREFLELCGYEPFEIQTESARVSAALARVGVTEEDLDTGKRRLATYYDLELVGVRKVLGLLLKEFTNIVLARDEGYDRVAFSFMAPGCQLLGAGTTWSGAATPQSPGLPPPLEAPPSPATRSTPWPGRGSWGGCRRPS